MSRNGFLAICLGAAALWGAQASAAELVTNGGFEVGGGSLDGWTVSLLNGVQLDTAFPNLGSADAAFTSSDGPGILSQDISTTAGTSYDLRFALFNAGGLFDSSFVVTFGGFSQSFVGFNVLGPSYAPQHFLIDGASISGANTSLSFAGIVDGTTFATWNLDDVSLHAVPVAGVPEPATWAMMLVGFGGLGMTLRRRSQSRRAQLNAA